jgi:signal transduction histidine kinase
MPIEWVFIEIFVTTVEVAAVFYLLCSKFDAKYRSVIPTLLFVILNVGVFSIAFFNLNYLPPLEIIAFFVYLSYLILFRKGNLWRKIIWASLAKALLLCIAFLSVTILSYISGETSLNIITGNSSIRLQAMVIARTTQIIVFYLLALNKNKYEKVYSLSTVLNFVIPLVSFVAGFFIYRILIGDTDNNIPDTLIYVVAISYLIMNVMVIILYEIISREAEKNYISVAKNTQHELTEEHNKQVVEMYHRMRGWRHDYANHMQSIVGMLEKAEQGDNVSGAIDYIIGLDEKITSASLDIVTGHYIVDAIISAKATLASVHDILFEHTILMSDDITVEDTDLCSILSNLLDNAIEACCKLDGKRYINIEMIIFEDQFNIRVSNSTNGEYNLENDKLKTTKSGDLHGIGMGHVKSIVEYYGGIFSVNPESESFTVHVSIPQQPLNL